MSNQERQQTILNILKDFKGTDPLKTLFWSELSYQRINEPLSRRGWPESAATTVAEDPVLFAGGGENNDFHVIYTRLTGEKLLTSHERPVVSRLLRDHPYTLFVFSNAAQDRWHFLNVKYDEKTAKRRLFRRITIGPEERLRTATERISLLSLDASGQDLVSRSPLAIQQRHDEAFDVEAVTKQFFGEYKALFGIVQDDLRRQTRDSEWSHDYALQLLNRCMFLYFIQRKRWLGDNPEFLRSFWESYQQAGQPRDSFFDRWLNILFFEAFNNKFHGGHRHFPGPIKHALALAPYLNGGLFSKNDLDTRHDFSLTDARFAQVFTFLERYNFTIAEDSPLDQEVAVDPEMIGKVYESLVNVSTEADERGDAGIFYTPRTEIDLMCRLALVDNLCNHLGATHKQLLYESIFAFDQDEKAQADEALAQANLWPQLDQKLRDIAVVDPACGSGSFLVGMLHILDDLQQRASRQLDRQETPFDRKKRIIGDNLYGVDIMDWACHVAELRLWLALVIDADFTREPLHVRREPLLPHFTFKIRCGDSLVEEVGGINMARLHGAHGIPAALKARITRLKTEKLKFYNNDPTCQFHSAARAKQEELCVFREILDTRRQNLEQELRSLRRQIETPERRQIGLLDGQLEDMPDRTRQQAEQQKRLASIKTDLERISQAKTALRSVRDVPFIWDIAFVEIFGEDKNGFDIVIGNPPYVRQENISDPRLPRGEVTTENKKEYKRKLARSVYQAFPRFFRYKASTDTSMRKLDAKSDLYIYFYFQGLSFLNTKGSLCFITSNAWLDVGYGADLQEFLLKHSHVRLIIDNQSKRSFASADVNTIIALLAAPELTKESGLETQARFLMLNTPFELVLSPVIFQEIAEITKPKRMNEYRLYPVVQSQLLEEGMSIKSNEETSAERNKALIKEREYTGNKWGGRYLRAPDVYMRLMQTQVPMLRLGAETFWRFGRGRRTGCDRFFYLTKEKARTWAIEKRYLKPLVKSPTDFVECGPESSRLRNLHYVFMCHDDKRQLCRTNALKYIRHGESQGYDKGTLQAVGGRWYDLGKQPLADIILPIAFNDRFFVVLNDAQYEVHQRFATLILAEKERHLVPLFAAYFSSTLMAFMAEIFGRRGLGQGALDFPPDDWRYVLIPDARCLSPESRKRLESNWEHISASPPMSVDKALQDEAHRELDLAVMTVLGFNVALMTELYQQTA
ncbi:MAG TPA: Eco57I restriction-modification methylase domain-containing protein, partial [Syntrophales bacterium]|nr:Eco57I restriction-modification methylase domain-containing protein [Syntrophales bacterium]